MCLLGYWMIFEHCISEKKCKSFSKFSKGTSMHESANGWGPGELSLSCDKNATMRYKALEFVQGVLIFRETINFILIFVAPKFWSESHSLSYFVASWLTRSLSRLSIHVNTAKYWIILKVFVWSFWNLACVLLVRRRT